MTDSATPPEHSASQRAPGAPEPPVSPQNKQPSPPDTAEVLQETWEQVKRFRDRYLLLVTFLLYGFNGVLAKLLDDLGVLKLWQVFLLTAPLVVAVAIIAYRIFAGLEITIPQILVTVVLSAVATWIIGLGSGQVVRDAFNVPDTSQCLRINTAAALV